MCFSLLCTFLFFHIVMEKMLKSKKEDFNQQMGCKTPVRLLKYTTDIHGMSKISLSLCPSHPLFKQHCTFCTRLFILYLDVIHMELSIDYLRLKRFFPILTRTWMMPYTFDPNLTTLPFSHALMVSYGKSVTCHVMFYQS